SWGYVRFSVFCFGAAAAAALSHRLSNTGSLRCYVWGLRFHAVGRTDDSVKCLTVRANFIELARISKLFSAISLAVGAIVLAFAFSDGLSARRSSTQQSPHA